MNEIEPDLGLSLLAQGRGDDTIVFTRVRMFQIARMAPALFTQVQNLDLEQTYCLSFDFAAPQMAQLLVLMPPMLAEPMTAALAAPFLEPHVFDLSEHALEVDLRARIGPAQTNDNERFAPLVVESFGPPSGSYGFRFEAATTPVANANPPAAPPPEPRPPPARKARPIEPFLTSDPEEQEDAVWHALILRGALTKDDAVRAAAATLRERGALAYQRLDSAGELYRAIQKAIDRNVAEGCMDRPQRGYVRACIEGPEQLERHDWQALLTEVLRDSPMPRVDVVRAVAERARDVAGLPFERLRDDGKIAVAIRAAINGALRKDLVVVYRGILTIPDDANAVANEHDLPVAKNRTSATPDVAVAKAVGHGVPVLAFSWGYYGWGNHTRELVDMMDRVEAARGFAPPLWVDVRLRRQVRALGFRERAFEQQLGPDRYAWLRGLGNRMIGDRDVAEPTLDRPEDIDLLLERITTAAAGGRRVIFFCACKSPVERHVCHRGLVVDLLVKTARRRKLPIGVQEWPGGTPSEVTLEVDREQMDKLVAHSLVEAQNVRLSLPAGVDLVRAASLPHLSLLRCREGDREVTALSGPVVYTAHGWVFPLYVVRPSAHVDVDVRKGYLSEVNDLELQRFGAQEQAAVPPWLPIALHRS